MTASTDKRLLLLPFILTFRQAVSALPTDRARAITLCAPFSLCLSPYHRPFPSLPSACDDIPQALDLNQYDLLPFTITIVIFFAGLIVALEHATTGNATGMGAPPPRARPGHPAPPLGR